MQIQHLKDKNAFGVPRSKEVVIKILEEQLKNTSKFLEKVAIVEQQRGSS